MIQQQQHAVESFLLVSEIRMRNALLRKVAQRERTDNSLTMYSCGTNVHWYYKPTTECDAAGRSTLSLLGGKRRRTKEETANIKNFKSELSGCGVEESIH